MQRPQLSTPTAERKTILLPVFLLGYGIYLQGFDRWRGRTTTEYVFSNANKGEAAKRRPVGFGLGEEHQQQRKNAGTLLRH